MKITVEPAPAKPKYPYLGVILNIDGEPVKVVLFSSKNEGTLLFDSRESVIGAYLMHWDEAKFEPLVGTITLEN